LGQLVVKLLPLSSAPSAPTHNETKGTLTVAGRASTDLAESALTGPGGPGGLGTTDALPGRSRRLAGWRPSLGMAAMALFGLVGVSSLSGCGPSLEEARSNVFLASANGLNIDSLVSRNLEPDNAENKLVVSASVQAALTVWRKDGDSEKALAALEATVAESPRDASAHYYAAQMHLRLKHPDLAVAGFRKALELRTDLPEIWLDMAVALVADEKPAEAYQAAHTAVAADPASPHTLHRAARIFYQTQNHTAAEVAYKSLTAMEPDDPSTWHDRGRNLAMAKSFNLATVCFDKSTELYANIEQPTAAQQRARAEMLTDYGIMAQWEHADEKAKILFENATAIDKTYAMAWFKLSQQQSVARLKPLYNIEAAVINANTAVSLSAGQNAEFLHQLAKVYAINGNIDRAVIAEQAACSLVKNKYDHKLALLKKLQADRSKAFNPDNF
jgi:Tfp pilus assembly protein PilF